ncbi:MAG: DASH family cryptochrome [Myxococcota bacterium]|nr:DASH family cryptochrome [Myxococcota bacterium]
MKREKLNTNHVVVWHRTDLRLDDNWTLTKAIELGIPLCAVYIIDPFWLESGLQGIERCGSKRFGALLESLADLAEQYRAVGHDLVVRVGDTVTELARIAAETNASHIFFTRGKTTYERQFEDRLQAALGDELELVGQWNDVLLNPDVVAANPMVSLKTFSRFRRSVEVNLSLPSPRPAPKKLNANPLAKTQVPHPNQFGLEEYSIHSDSPIADLDFGSTGAFKQLERYLWDSDSIAHYKQTRNGMLQWSESSRLSVYLAFGCISPIRLFHEIDRYELNRTKNESTYWLKFELLWREYFHHLAYSVGAKLFQLGGTQGVSRRWRGACADFDAWCKGETGIPLIDANMVELNETGYMSNRGRQIVASYLAKELGIDWRLGAAWFECQLIDYDPCVNWGNWQYQAGVGVDAKDRRFNVQLQAKRYDARTTYVRRWLGERYTNVTNEQLIALNAAPRP